MRWIRIRFIKPTSSILVWFVIHKQDSGNPGSFERERRKILSRIPSVYAFVVKVRASGRMKKRKEKKKGKSRLYSLEKIGLNVILSRELEEQLHHADLVFHAIKQSTQFKNV